MSCRTRRAPKLLFRTNRMIGESREALFTTVWFYRLDFSACSMVGCQGRTT